MTEARTPALTQTWAVFGLASSSLVRERVHVSSRPITDGEGECVRPPMAYFQSRSFFLPHFRRNDLTPMCPSHRCAHRSASGSVVGLFGLATRPVAPAILLRVGGDPP